MKKSIKPEVTEQFITDLFAGNGGVDDGLNNFIQVWTKKNKTTRYFKDISAATNFISKFDGDVYIACGLASKKYGPKVRCKAADIAGIGGLWADIDISHRLHGKDYPPTEDAALKLLAAVGLKPTYIIHSGHGLQAWWMFKEPWIFDNDDERQQAATLSKRLIKTLQNAANKKTWTVDSVGDLARLMRIPGTTNCKDPDSPKPVRIIDKDGPRCNPDGFDDLLDELTREEKELSNVLPFKKATGTDVEANSALIFNEDAELPSEKLADLFVKVKDFKCTWERKHKNGDPSKSGYHMRLAHAGVRNGWTDQEIHNLFVSWNKRHSEPLEKLQRLKYVQDTIDNARLSVPPEDLEEHWKQSLQLLERRRYNLQCTYTKDELETFRKGLQFKIGLLIQKVEKYDTDNPPLFIHCGKGIVIEFPAMKDFTSPTKARALIYSQINYYIGGKISGVDWGHICNMIAILVEVVFVSHDSHMRHALAFMLGDFLALQYKWPFSALSKECRISYFQDGHWYVILDRFQAWLKQKRNLEISTRQLSKVFQQIGLKSTRNARPFEGSDVKGKPKKGSIRSWKVPAIYRVGTDVVEYSRAGEIPQKGQVPREYDFDAVYVAAA